MEKSQLKGQGVKAISAQTAMYRVVASDLGYRPSHSLWCPHCLQLPAACLLLTLPSVSVLTHMCVNTHDRKLENTVRFHASTCRYPQHVLGGRGYESSLLCSPALPKPALG